MSQDTVSPGVVQDLYGGRLSQLREGWLTAVALLASVSAAALFGGLSSTFRSQWEALFPLTLFLSLAVRQKKAWTQLRRLTPQEAFKAKLL